MKMQKVKIGDIAEIKTPAGCAYVQYTHEGGDMGQIVRVLPNLFPSRPTDFVELAKQKELYFIFYTLKYALQAGETEIVSNQPIPDWAKPMPLMRHAAGRSPEGKVLNWRIVSASNPLTLEFLQNTPAVRQLTPEQRRLSIHQLWPHPVIVKEIARGWTPERAEALEEEDRNRAQSRSAEQITVAADNRAVRHYLYFRQKANAQKAGDWFRSQGLSVEVRRGADAENWLTLVKHAPIENNDKREKLRKEMAALAVELDGEYDGWEIAM